MENYTSGHETRSRLLGDNRFEYPDNHIEADNRLSWFTGILDEKFGDNALYIHLVRDENEIAKSYLRRFKSGRSIVNHFAEGILMLEKGNIDSKTEQRVANMYVHTVNSNIEHFLKDKTNTVTISLKNIKSDFRDLWKQIGAKGNLNRALAEFDIRHNKSHGNPKGTLRFRLKLFLRRFFPGL